MSHIPNYKKSHDQGEEAENKSNAANSDTSVAPASNVPVLPSIVSVLPNEPTQSTREFSGPQQNAMHSEPNSLTHLPPLRTTTVTTTSTYTFSLPLNKPTIRTNQALPSLSSLGLSSSGNGKLGSCSTISSLRSSPKFSTGMRIDTLLSTTSPESTKPAQKLFEDHSDRQTKDYYTKPLSLSVSASVSTTTITEKSTTNQEGKRSASKPHVSVCSLENGRANGGYDSDNPTEANSFVVEKLNRSPGGSKDSMQPRQCLWSTCAQIFTSIDDLVRHLYKLHVATNRSSHPVPPPQQQKQLNESLPAFQEGNASSADEPLKVPASSSSITASINVSFDHPVGSQRVNSIVSTPDRVDAKLSLSSATSDFLCKWASCHALKHDTNDLIQHVCREHLGAVRIFHRCHWSQCHEEYEHIDDLTNHLSNSHVGSGQHEYICEWEGCERSGRPFTQRQRAMRHIQTHTGDKPFSCDTCKKRFSEAHIMQQHMRTHTGEKPYKCAEAGCEKEFAVSSALTIHVRTHTGERPYQCRHFGCTKRFSESSNLTKHMRVHTGERPFKCPDLSCGKTFSRPDQVTRHQRMHTGEKPFACPIDECTKKFATSTTCLNHVKHLHKLDQSSLAELGLSIKKRNADESGPASKVKRLQK